MDKKVTNRIKKLLALAKSANEIGSANEAATVFARAQVLATKHQIELAEIRVSGEIETDPMLESRIEAGATAAGWKKVLISLVCSASGVFVYAERVRSGTGPKKQTDFVLAGRQEAVRTAIYMYHMIAIEIAHLGAAARRRGEGAIYVNAFRLGAAVRVGERMVAQVQKTAKQARADGASAEAIALIADDAAAAGRWIAQRDPEMKMRKTRPVGCSSKAGFVAGGRAGDGVNIGGNRAVGESQRKLVRK